MFLIMREEMDDKVLFVDDEKAILTSVRRLFLDKQINVQIANNSEEALSIIRNNNISVIVSDNIMPGVRGVDLLERVSRISPDTIRIMMTGYADLSTTIDAINKCGVYKFIVKPWANNELVSIIEEAITRYRVIQSLKETDEPTMRSLAQTIELKDRYTKGHCDRVASYSLIIADHLNLQDDTKKQIKYGCWLHDCGKIGVSEEILNKPGPLTDGEYEIIKKHPEWGAEVAKQANLSQEIVNIILYHHERYDGKGYPLGIKGDEIPQEARIVAIADVFDAITSDRSYQKKREFSEAKNIIASMKRTAFDPHLVDIFLRSVNNTRIEQICLTLKQEGLVEYHDTTVESQGSFWYNNQKF